MEELVVSSHVADADRRREAKARRVRLPDDVLVERALGPVEQIGAQSAVPVTPPFVYRHDLRGTGYPELTEVLDRCEVDRFGRSAETIGKQKPAVLGEVREELPPDGDDPHEVEPGHEELDQGRSVRCMADGGRDHERHSTAGPEQTCRHDEERRPGCGERREWRPELGAQVEGPAPHLALERLVSDERGVAGGAVEAMRRLFGPREEVRLVQQGTRRTLSRGRGGGPVPLHPHAVRVAGQEPPVPARRVEERVRTLADRPLHQRRRHRVRRVERTVLLGGLSGLAGHSRHGGNQNVPIPVT